eukprot:TRINITY_DN5129_c0_g2_i1.p1 TRINITY_DN5129_c0_g2~~TRINITY_DN5129_c0_g2_i1.p1  ORF type:complete len:100 (-),score=2.97 TRINITY_DN5129_c0_g2_i1:817-1116(-)
MKTYLWSPPPTSSIWAPPIHSSELINICLNSKLNIKVKHKFDRARVIIQSSRPAFGVITIHGPWSQYMEGAFSLRHIIFERENPQGFIELHYRGYHELY